MNGWLTPTVIIFCIVTVFGAGGAFLAIDSVEERVTKVEEEVILRPEFEAVVERVEDGQDRIEKDVDEIKGDVKSIEQMIQQHYGVGDNH